jgi:hypothetical protein
MLVSILLASFMHAFTRKVSEETLFYNWRSRRIVVALCALLRKSKVVLLKRLDCLIQQSMHAQAAPQVVPTQVHVLTAAIFQVQIRTCSLIRDEETDFVLLLMTVRVYG